MARAKAAPHQQGKGRRKGVPAKVVAKSIPSHLPIVVWLSVAVSSVSLITTVGQMFTTTATMQVTVSQVREDLKRNFDEDRRLAERHIKDIERVDATIGNLTKLGERIAVVETQLKSIGETLGRVERLLEAKGPRHQMAP